MQPTVLLMGNAITTRITSTSCPESQTRDNNYCVLYLRNTNENTSDSWGVILKYSTNMILRKTIALWSFHYPFNNKKYV